MVFNCGHGVHFMATKERDLQTFLPLTQSINTFQFFAKIELFKYLILYNSCFILYGNSRYPISPIKVVMSID